MAIAGIVPAITAGILYGMRAGIAAGVLVVPRVVYSARFLMCQTG